jgi:hypothetical protein
MHRTFPPVENLKGETALPENGTAPAERTRVTRLHVGRVYNLGNYENQRVEITVDIAEGDDPGRVYRNLEGILANLRASSGVSSYNLARAREVLAKPDAELNEAERGMLDDYRDRVAKVESAKQRRQAARDALSTLNFTTEHVDHKRDWDDDDYYDD